ncbi:succinyl-diaminopimelate desuccinylase [Pseudoalteromonas sp. SCSIO 43201]|uniref:succinyl-diaminopimelate desuccinylase n=1 Tax=Pseudoalteromonas sp. SCSIO 43201 TaxID=2822842 RepID=UPI002074B81C|nr:succinyl-diaminopimelate desuccinylase [Pseudoalteromonas sp. SCSIO 43201]USD29409.1 succinyl-diaminopimelate desuccinylase [Pseudoalteromonas sp. SCSIO 43201]
MSLAPQYLNTRTSYAIEILTRLIQAPSVTPCDAGTIAFMSEQLAGLGFTTEQFEVQGVKNLIASYHFSDGPILAFSGHVDVVPADNRGWIVPPFSAQIVDDVMYGRGAADMKAGIASMLSATRELLNFRHKLHGTFYWLLTSDEEGEAEFGSKLIADRLVEKGIELDACLVGEPTAHMAVGDTIKNGRRGAISGRVQIKGKAGHVAYPEQTINAAHIAGQLVSQLSLLPWWKDEAGSQTTLQVTGITVPNIVDNLVPSECEITFNIRYSHAYKSQEVMRYIQESLAKSDASLALTWERPCESFYTGAKQTQCFLTLVEQAIKDMTGQYPALSTAGGTSDGRFFATAKTQVIECGVKNDSIHQVNEHVSLMDIDTIEKIYLSVLKRFFIKDEIF